MQQINSAPTGLTSNPQVGRERMQPKIGPAQPKWLWAAGFVLMAVIGVAAMAMAYIWVSGGSGTPSGTTTAPALVKLSGDTRTFFSIAPTESEVRFLVDETLLGSHKTVVGSTTEVAGDLLVDFENPAKSQLGTLRINVRTLVTDNEFRTRALRGQILQADRDEYEYAEFTPVELMNLPENLSMGEPFAFTLRGNLTVHGVTREVVFDVTITPSSGSRLEGTASATVQYADFGMSIPEAPGVADVSHDVRLEIDFTALASY